MNRHDLLFDHFVGASEQRLRHGEAERFGGLEVYGELEFGGFLNRELSRVRSFKNTIYVICGPSPQVVIVDPIGN